jgi:Transmembrane domain of unknown function (DUF3566)
LDRRTNGPKGSGGASPTIVTSRTGDDVDDNEVTQATGIMAAPPRRTSRKAAGGTAPVTAAPANGDVSDRKANGTAAASDTPASDTPASDTPPSDQSTGTPTAVGPTEASGPDGARGAEADATLTDLPAMPALPADLVGPASSRSSGSSGSSPPVTETPTVSPAAFAWEMPDPPPSSPSSPARTFLRTGTNAKSATTSRTPGTTAPGPGKTAASDTAATDTGATRIGVGGTGIGGIGGTASVGAPPRSKPKKASSKRNARQAHLTVARVEPWSVMKFSFVVSLVAFVILFVAVSLLYGALDGLGVFDSLQRLVSSLTSSQGSAGVNASKWFSASRVLGYTALLGSLNIVLITAMSTIGAVVYNLTSRLVGGVEVTLRETELRGGAQRVKNHGTTRRARTVR